MRVITPHRTLPLLLLPSLLLLSVVTSVLWAASPSLDENPSQWSGKEVYQILNNSPWSRPVKVTSLNEGSDSFGNSRGAGDSNANNTPPPPANPGGMGRRGMTSGRSGGTYSSGGASKPTTSSTSGPTMVTVQWQSALVVRMAAEKKSGATTVDPASMKPPGEYVIALIGLPVTAVGGRAASADSQETMTGDEEQRIEQNVKRTAALVRGGHEPLTPNKVELDQGRDGRMLIHFPLSDPIQSGDKNVEFRLVMGKTKIQKKFPLKEMEYQGKLEL